MKVDIPTPSQVRIIIKDQIDEVVKALKQENMVLRRRIRGLEESIDVMTHGKNKKMSEL